MADSVGPMNAKHDLAFAFIIANSHWVKTNNKFLIIEIVCFYRIDRLQLIISGEVREY